MTDNPLVTKQRVRKITRRQRDAISRDVVVAWSEQAVARLLRFPIFQAASTVCTYVSVRNELRTRELIEQLWLDGKTVLVPVKDSAGSMELFRLDDWAQIRVNATGWVEPSIDYPFAGTVDAVLVPGLAFTDRGERLGSGAGHYDRFLANHPDSTSFGLAYEMQLLDNIPQEPHDQRLDFIVTEQRVIRTDT